MDYCTRLSKEVKAYHDRGLVALPVPEGQKKSPPTGTTGNNPTRTDDEIRALWEGVTGSSNLAWRLPDNVTGLDVDHGYNGKTGADTLKALEEDLGELPPTWSTTRRGADSKSRKMFYIVPEGFKWHAKAGADIDIIQRSHRYVIVAPSEVDGLAEQWYRPDGTPSDRAPLIEELAGLPEKWIEHLKKETFSLQNAPAEDLSWPEADDWLSKVAPGWESEPGPIFRSILEDEELFSDNGHDTMVKEQKHFLRLAVVDGETGLKKAMAELERLFIEEVSNRRGQEIAEWEFKSALYGEVDNLRGDIEHKKAVPFLVKYSPALLTGFTSLTGAAAVAKAHKDLTEKTARAMRMPAPLAVPRLIALLCPELVTVRNSGSEDSILNMAAGETLQAGDMREILEKTVMPEIHRYRIQFEDDSDEDKAGKAVLAEAMTLYKTARPIALFENTANAVRDMGRKFTASKIDANPYLLGVGDEVLDLQAVIDNPDGGLESWLRPREYEDAVTKSLTLDIRAGLKSLEYREQSPIAKETHTERLLKVIQPDEDTRQFLQKALGYSMFGKNKAHKFFVWFGPGGSGKGSVVDSVFSVLGEGVYASQITPEQFKKGSASKPDPKYAASLTTRMTFVNETDEGTKIDASAIKRATESRSGRALNSNHVVEQDGNTITFMTNRVFSFEHDSGVERRLAVIPFTQAKKAVKEAQPHIESEWREHEEEKVWLLRWLLEGFALAMSEGLEQEDYPPLVAQATARFIAEADPSMVFFQMLERTGDPDDYVPTADLKRVYRDVTGDLEIKERALEMKFSRWFADQGHPDDKRKRNNAWGYAGWVLSED